METIQWRSLCFAAGFNKSSRKLCQKNKSSIVIYHANVLYFWASTLSKKAISNQKQGLIQGTIEESVRTPRAFGNVVVFALLCFGKKRKQLREKMLHRRNMKKHQRLPNLVANGEQNWILMHITMFISVRLPKKALGMSKGVQMAPKNDIVVGENVISFINLHVLWSLTGLWWETLLILFHEFTSFCQQPENSIYKKRLLNGVNQKPISPFWKVLKQ